MEWLDRILGLLFLLTAAMLIIRGILATRVSGFKFYLVIYLGSGLLLVLSALILLVPKVSGGDPLLGSLILTTIPLFMMQVLQEMQEKKARTAFPAQWAAWEYKAKHDHPIKRFFYPSITRQKQPNSSSDSDARSNKTFLTSLVFMAVIGLIGVALIVLILLGRRGF